LARISIFFLSRLQFLWDLIIGERKYGIRDEFWENRGQEMGNKGWVSSE